jgi:hypothetical protein
MEKDGLSKYYTGKSVELMRSQIHFADYNPRRINPDNLKTLKRGIKKFGLVGGIVINQRTGNTLVSGHQRITAMDELQKYDPDTGKNDYKLRCEVVDIDDVAEKELLILLNNPNAQGEWDYNQLKNIVPDIDYTAAGLTDYDLTVMGLDIQNSVEAVAKTLAEGETAIPTMDFGIKTPPTDTPTAPPAEPKRDGHIYQRKAEISRNMDGQQEKQTAFVMVRFGGMSDLSDFLSMFDYPETTQVIDGNDFLRRLENY